MKKKFPLKAMYFLVVGLIVIALTVSACRYLQIDDCLDGGGRWDYEKTECVR